MRALRVAIPVVALLGFAGAAGCEAAAMPPAQEKDGAYILPAGPKVEGVVLVHQGAWPADAIRAFRETPWLDAASIRLRWAQLEPKDQEFDWRPIDRLLGEVRRYNADHAGAKRTLHIRVMGGEHCPKWFDQAGIRFYDTAHPVGRGRMAPLHIPVPYDNPEFIRQLREIYRAMVDRYKDEPLVSVYHGTWSAGPWDEIFHPQLRNPLPPGYTQEKFVRGMVEQLDVLIGEFSCKGKVAELPYSGKYPSKQQINITGPLTARIVERLGRRSPLLYLQSNGWGQTNTGAQTVSWGHEQDIHDAFGQVNLALQALGTNAGGGWFPQGDWMNLVALAQQYEVAYVEIYPPDLMPLDTKHHIVEAFTHAGPSGDVHGMPAGFLGLRPWLAKRDRTLYVREAVVNRVFEAGPETKRLRRVELSAAAPPGTSVRVRARSWGPSGPWGKWREAPDLDELAPGPRFEIEAILHTDDGCLTPRITRLTPVFGQP